jgi:hypothetical protein
LFEECGLGWRGLLIKCDIRMVGSLWLLTLGGAFWDSPALHWPLSVGVLLSFLPVSHSDL